MPPVRLRIDSGPRGALSWKSCLRDACCQRKQPAGRPPNLVSSLETAGAATMPHDRGLSRDPPTAITPAAIADVCFHRLRANEAIGAALFTRSRNIFPLLPQSDFCLPPGELGCNAHRFTNKKACCNIYFFKKIILVKNLRLGNGSLCTVRERKVPPRFSRRWREKPEFSVFGSFGLILGWEKEVNVCRQFLLPHDICFLFLDHISSTSFTA